MSAKNVSFFWKVPLSARKWGHGWLISGRNNKTPWCYPIQPMEQIQVPVIVLVIGASFRQNFLPWILLYLLGSSRGYNYRSILNGWKRQNRSFSFDNWRFFSIKLCVTWAVIWSIIKHTFWIQSVLDKNSFGILRRIVDMPRRWLYKNNAINFVKQPWNPG